MKIAFESAEAKAKAISQLAYLMKCAGYIEYEYGASLKEKVEKMTAFFHAASIGQEPDADDVFNIYMSVVSTEVDR